MRPATAPVISAGVIMANIIWKTTKVIEESEGAYASASLKSRPLRQIYSSPPMMPPWSAPKDKENPTNTHKTTESPIMPAQAIIVFTIFFRRTRPP